MRISGEKRSELYNAFATRVMDLRIELYRRKDLVDSESIDARLFKLESEIWIDIKKALNI